MKIDQKNVKIRKLLQEVSSPVMVLFEGGGVMHTPVIGVNYTIPVYKYHIFTYQLYHKSHFIQSSHVKF